MRSYIVGVLAGSFLAGAAFADGPNTMIVFDASGSMWGQIEGTTKIEIARNAFANAQDAWAGTDQNVGLIAYGHRRKGDCGDIETLVPLSSGGSAGIAQKVQSLRPKGKTPLSDAIRMAARELRFREEAATVVLFSDGIETCNADPCALATELEQDGIDFTAHVIGFGLSSDTDRAQLQCIADNTGGTFLEARDAQGLEDALTRVATEQTPIETTPEPVDTIAVRINLEEVEGTARPDQVTLRATDIATGEKQVLGAMRGAAEVIQGLQAELPVGDWLIEAISEEGKGEVTLAISAETQQIDVPFKANDTSFVLRADGPFRLGVEHMFFLGVTNPLQANADYTVALFPAGATEYDQWIDWETRFGSDSTGFTEHGLAPPEVAGNYEVIVLRGYDLSAADARFPIVYEDNAPVRWRGKTRGAPGEALPIRISGDAYPNNNLALRTGDGTEVISQWLQAYVTPDEGPVLVLPETAGVYELVYRATSEEGEISLGEIIVGKVVLEDDADAVAPPTDEANAAQSGTAPGTIKAALVDKDGQLMDLPAQWTLTHENGTEVFSTPQASGLVRFDGIAPGTYRLVAYREEDWGGTTEAIAQVVVTNGQTVTVDIVAKTLGEDIGDHSTPAQGEAADTMLSEEELAAETGPRDDIHFEIDNRCDGEAPCNIKDPRVSLDYMLPPGWASSEAFYHTTAGGAQAEHPTVFMARLTHGQFDVALNPRQWDAMLGPCEEIPQGVLCRTESEVVRDLADYELIRNSFFGMKPLPKGYLEVGRNWTLKDRVLDTPVGILKIEPFEIGAETATGLIQIFKPAVVGAQPSGPVETELHLYWREGHVVDSLFGEAEIGGTAVTFRLARPDGWDGTTNIFRGELTNKESFKGVLINAF